MGVPIMQHDWHCMAYANYLYRLYLEEFKK